MKKYSKLPNRLNKPRLNTYVITNSPKHKKSKDNIFDKNFEKIKINKIHINNRKNANTNTQSFKYGKENYDSNTQNNCNKNIFNESCRTHRDINIIYNPRLSCKTLRKNDNGLNIANNNEKSSGKINNVCVSINNNFNYNLSLSKEKFDNKNSNYNTYKAKPKEINSSDKNILGNNHKNKLFVNKNTKINSTNKNLLSEIRKKLKEIKVHNNLYERNSNCLNKLYNSNTINKGISKNKNIFLPNKSKIKKEKTNFYDKNQNQISISQKNYNDILCIKTYKSKKSYENKVAKNSSAKNILTKNNISSNQIEEIAITLNVNSDKNQANGIDNNINNSATNLHSLIDKKKVKNNYLNYSTNFAKDKGSYALSINDLKNNCDNNIPQKEKTPLLYPYNNSHFHYSDYITYYSKPHRPKMQNKIYKNYVYIKSNNDNNNDEFEENKKKISINKNKDLHSLKTGKGQDEKDEDNNSMNTIIANYNTLNPSSSLKYINIKNNSPKKISENYSINNEDCSCKSVKNLYNVFTENNKKIYRSGIYTKKVINDISPSTKEDYYNIDSNKYINTSIIIDNNNNNNTPSFDKNYRTNYNFYNGLSNNIQNHIVGMKNNSVFYQIKQCNINNNELMCKTSRNSNKDSNIYNISKNHSLSSGKSYIKCHGRLYTQICNTNNLNIVPKKIVNKYSSFMFKFYNYFIKAPIKKNCYFSKKFRKNNDNDLIEIDTDFLECDQNDNISSLRQVNSNNNKSLSLNMSYSFTSIQKNNDINNKAQLSQISENNIELKKYKKQFFSWFKERKNKDSDDNQLRFKTLNNKRNKSLFELVNISPTKKKLNFDNNEFSFGNSNNNNSNSNSNSKSNFNFNSKENESNYLNFSNSNNNLIFSFAFKNEIIYLLNQITIYNFNNISNILYNNINIIQNYEMLVEVVLNKVVDEKKYFDIYVNLIIELYKKFNNSLFSNGLLEGCKTKISELIELSLINNYKCETNFDYIKNKIINLINFVFELINNKILSIEVGVYCFEKLCNKYNDILLLLIKIKKKNHIKFFLLDIIVVFLLNHTIIFKEIDYLGDIMNDINKNINDKNIPSFLKYKLMNLIELYQRNNNKKNITLKYIISNNDIILYTIIKTDIENYIYVTKTQKKYYNKNENFFKKYTLDNIIYIYIEVCTDNFNEGNYEFAFLYKKYISEIIINISENIDRYNMKELHNQLVNLFSNIKDICVENKLMARIFGDLLIILIENYLMFARDLNCFANKDKASKSLIGKVIKYAILSVKNKYNKEVYELLYKSKLLMDNRFIKEYIVDNIEL